MLCEKCSNQKIHCFSHGLCGVNFIQTIIYEGKEISFCSQECGLNFYNTVLTSRFNLHTMKY